MQRKHKLMAGLAAVAILAGTTAAIPRTFAAESTADNPVNGLVEKLAAKFNLDKNEIQSVFDEDRSEREAERKTEMKERTEERLAQAVEDGKLTEDQKNLILAELEQFRSQMDALADLDDEGEQQAAIAQLKADLFKWAADQNIDSRWLAFGGDHGFGKGPGGPGRGMHGGPKGGGGEF